MIPRGHGQRGGVLGVLLHAVLLVVVVGQILYLAGRYRLRADWTANSEYSLTATTESVLGGLEQELRVECYLSPVDDLPPRWVDARRELDNFLAELIAASDGRVSVRRYDPSADGQARGRAVRLRVEPIPEVDSRALDSASSRLVWQGLRLLYGAERQAVLPQITPADCSPRKLQALLVPRIRELVSGAKPVIGYMEWPTPPGNPRTADRPMLARWELLRTRGDLAERYRWVDCRTDAGGFIPEEVELLVMFSPRRLDDRLKFAIDQFLLRGGRVLLYSDLNDYFLGADRTLDKRPRSDLDFGEGKISWVEQLAHYGIRIQNAVVSDRTERAILPLGNVVGNPPQFQPVEFPYGFRCLGRDWKSQADVAARLGGDLDPQLKARLEEILLPGLDPDHPVLRSFAGTDAGPGFLWPHPVRLVNPLPDGVVGAELARTSALGIEERAPASLDALGSGRPPAIALRKQTAFRLRYQELAATSLPTQVPVMAEVAGAFTSAFAADGLPDGLVARPPSSGSPAGGDEETEPTGPDVVGPTLPEPGAQGGGDQGDGDQVVDFIRSAKAPGRLVVVGDAVALRDDVIGGSYNNLGGPGSLSLGGSYILFTGLVDWLAGEEDLMELRVRDLADRRIALVERQSGQDRLSWQLAVRNRENLLAGVAIGLPTVLLLALGIVMGFRRRAARQRISQVGANLPSPAAAPREAANPRA